MVEGWLREGTSRLRWRVSHGCFWLLGLEGKGTDVAVLVQRARKIARGMGYTKMFWQVLPETGGALLKTLEKGRAKIDYVQMYCEV